METPVVETPLRVVEAEACSASAGKWPIDDTVTNAQAIEALQMRDSGVRPLRGKPIYRALKRAFDIVASGAAILVLFIPSVVLSAVICIKSPGAGPLYSQVRVGGVRRDGSYKLFKIHKFRSMVPEADTQLINLKDRNEADGPLFKIKQDPRVIPGVGAWIRKHSIDELPQLLNVFKGDMSLIGPRPALPREVMQYDARAMQRLRVKCGCGGAWQAGERSDAGFDKMVAMDLSYIEKRGVVCDLSLVIGTLCSMFVGDGAY